MSKSVEETDQPLGQTDDATKFFLGARSALKIGDMGAAERLLRRSLDISPNNYLYMLTLARLLVQMDKNSTESEALLLESSKLKIDAVEPRLILSAVYEKQGRIRTTQSILKSVINIDPTNFVARRKLSQLNGEISQDEEQIKLRKEIIDQCLVVKTADLPLITSSTIVRPDIEQVLANPENQLLEIDKTTNPIVEEHNLSEPPHLINASESGYIGLGERLAVAGLLAVEPPNPIIENQEALFSATNDVLETNHVVETPQSPSIEGSFTRDIWSSISEDTVIEVLKLETDYLLAIIRDFFFAVKDQVGEPTAFLLFKRSKQQIESLYPELDYFEIQEDHRIIEFVSGERYLGKRALESLTTWMYLFMILLQETSYLREEAREKALEQALPKSDDILEEKLFRQYFNEIQL